LNGSSKRKNPLKKTKIKKQPFFNSKNHESSDVKKEISCEVSICSKKQITASVKARSSF